MGEVRERLKHGKALCGKVFGNFVETFNWLVDFCTNVKGDGDAGGVGKIVVDRMGGGHPVIRCKGCAPSSTVSAETSPSPFQYSESDHSIGNRSFYWDGVLKTIASDYTVGSSDTAVWLVATQPAPSSSGEQPWAFALSNAQGQAQDGGRVLNFKLYDMSEYAVTCDYRTTFLALNSPHKVAKFTVEKPGSGNNPTATLDATGTTAKLELSASSNSVTIDPSGLSQGTAAQFHTLTVHHSDGTADDVYDVIADDDIEITEGLGGGEKLTDVEIVYDSTDHILRILKTFTASDGTTRTEYSDGYGLETAEVVTSSDYASNDFVNHKKSIYVIDSDPEYPDDETVFTTVPHSENT